MKRLRFLWRLRTRSLPLGERTLLLGIVNVTPDSFSDGGKYLSTGAAVDHGLRLLDEGADILDLGGESTRPGATAVTSEEEQARVLPVLRALLEARPDAVISVDTYHAATAQAALDAGAEIINDVSGLMWDPAMAALLGREKPGAILMHIRGTPGNWQNLPPLASGTVTPLVLGGLASSLKAAMGAGLTRERIVLDPGFGFGKLGEENFVLLAELAELGELGCPLLAGVSRKRFLTGGLSNVDDASRLNATTAANVLAVMAGVHLLRVHDVTAALAAINVVDKVLRGQEA